MFPTNPYFWIHRIIWTAITAFAVLSHIMWAEYWSVAICLGAVIVSGIHLMRFHYKESCIIPKFTKAYIRDMQVSDVCNRLEIFILALSHWYITAIFVLVTAVIVTLTNYYTFNEEVAPVAHTDAH